MLKANHFAFSLCLLSAFSFRPGQDNISNDEYRMYSIVIDSLRSHWPTATVLLHENTIRSLGSDTVWISQASDTSKRITTLWDRAQSFWPKIGLEKLRKEFDEKNSHRYLISRDFIHLKNAILFPDSARPTWESLNDRYGTVLVIHLSRIAIDAEGGIALLETRYSCGIVCGESFLILFIKSPRGWILKDQKVYMVS